MGCVTAKQRLCRYCFNKPPKDGQSMGLGVCSSCMYQVNLHPETRGANSDLIRKVEGVRSKIAVKLTEDMMTVKNPLSSEMLIYKEELEPILLISDQIADTPIEIISHCSFQWKLAWFRAHVERHRIPWDKGCEWLAIDRQNVLFSGIQAMKKVNFRKELKIKFQGEKVDDAGGLLREWMHMSMNEIFDPDLGLFELCKTTEPAYKISNDRDLIEEFALSSMEVLGTIVGKALFERIPINCCFNRALIRLICGQMIEMHDLYSFDEELYRSWTQILKCKNVEELSLDWYITTPVKNDRFQKIKLNPQCPTAIVKEQTKQEYLKKAILYYCYKSSRQYIEKLKEAIYKVIPSGLLTVFQPHEFEMILNGPGSINVEDWKSNTLYEGGYSAETPLIVDFWEIINKLSYSELKNLLHYCTGVTRVPLHGFSRLESNRGQIRKFTIRKVELEKENPYPKAYTCFNRLELPEYSTNQELRKFLSVVYSQEIKYFGLG